MRLRRLGRAAVLAAALPLSGCAATFGGYDLAPNGLTRADDAFRRDLAFDPVGAYTSVLEGKLDGDQPLPDDDLLRLLYAGVAGHYAGAWEESSRLLDVASYLAEDRVTTSVSREALSMLTSDRALLYTPGHTERLMIPYLAALNYLQAGDPEEAAVEARRIEALLDQWDEDTAPADVPGRSRFLHYFAGAVFEAAHEWNAADVAYRRAGPLAEALGRGPAAGSGPARDSLGDVLVLIERGFVPHRVEQSVAVVLPPFQVERLTDGSVGDKAAAALDAAGRILVTASAVYGDRSAYYHDRGFHRTLELDPWRRDGDHSDDDPYLLRMAWPVLFQEPAPAAPLRVRAGELGVDAVARLDLATATRRDFDAERATLVARTVLRAAAKMALAKSLEGSVSKKDEAAGELVGVLANLGTALTERADTRCWHLLPGSVSMVRLRLPAGAHDLVVELDRDDGGVGGTVSLGSVLVRPGATAFVTTRLWR